VTDKTDKTNKITWDNCSYGPCISAESFVRTWQTSDSVADFQREVMRQTHESGYFQERLDDHKEWLSECAARLCAIQQKDLESPLLNKKDIAALKGTKVKFYSWEPAEVVHLGDHIEDLEKAVSRHTDRITHYQRILDDPEGSVKKGGGIDRIPCSSTLQSRAQRYRKKGVSLQYLTYDNEPPVRCRWKVLSELADELAA
jgi:hypothetical protein